MSIKKALPRGYRQYPQSYRVFSNNFPDNMLKAKDKCFVPLEDYKTLEAKYIKLFKRYKKGGMK